MDVNSFVLGFMKGKASGGGGGSMDGFHKVRFFNDDRTTLLYTVFVPTGASAMYAGDTPLSTADGTAFRGFEPSPVNITADLDCYAVYDTVGTLDETSWADISALSENGKAQNYFAVGDVKMIHIEGTVGTLAVNSDYGVYILGFDHNEELEGRGIHFGTFKSALSNGVDIALSDADVDTTAKVRFNMNHWGSSSSIRGGWAGCDMRYDILGSTDNAPSGYGSLPDSSRVGYDPSTTCATTPVSNTLMAALPTDLRAVMKPMTKYTSNTGDAADNEEKVTVTTDYLPLLAEFEIFGERTNANSYEQEKQMQYDYFATGNSKIKYRHHKIESSVPWWERSRYYTGGVSWCYVAASGASTSYQANQKLGVAPIFKV